MLVELASRDLWFDRKVSLCIVASIIAVIAPLLLLFGLKNGVVTQLRDNLLSDPRNLEIRMLGNGNLDQPWIDALKAQPATGFVMPLTRSLNTQADLVKDSQHFAADAEVIPSAPGDPLLQGKVAPPPSAQDVVLSAAAAKKLLAKPGDTLQLVVIRKLDGNNERGRVTLTVSGVLDETAFGRPAALVTLDLLLAMEQFRDGVKMPAFGLDTGTEATQTQSRFARARIYAKSLDDVAPLADWLQQRNIEVSTRARDIESVKAIDRVLSLIFAVIAWTAVIGCIASLIGAFLANIDRKRKDLALLRLLGFRRGYVGAYVMVQAALLTGIAFVIGYLAYLAGSSVFNRALGTNLADGAFVCHLENSHIALAFVSALLIATLVAGIGGFRAIHIQPAESLREI
ncbi:MAG: ABC transporter permease [Gammaproteobacteria bacterium]|nr:ABC transporter permease [Gammaproteobacteria bacterium]